MLTIAHRGASAIYPENTLRAFIEAAELGADMCEFDVRMTRDGEVVVIHDATVNRTTDGRGRVAAMGAAVDSGEDWIEVRRRGPLKGIDADFNMIPDAAMMPKVSSSPGPRWRRTRINVRASSCVGIDHSGPRA